MPGLNQVFPFFRQFFFARSLSVIWRQFNISMEGTEILGVQKLEFAFPYNWRVFNLCIHDVSKNLRVSLFKMFPALY